MDILIDNSKRKEVVDALKEYDESIIKKNKLNQEFKNKYTKIDELIKINSILEKYDKIYEAKFNQLSKISTDSEKQLNDIQDSAAKYEKEALDLIKKIEESGDFKSNEFDLLDEVGIKLKNLSLELEKMMKTSDHQKTTILADLNNLEELKRKEEYINKFRLDVSKYNSSLEEINKKIQELKNKLSENILSLYDAARNSLKYDLPIIVKSSNNENSYSCICGLTDNADELSKKISENGIAQCPNCGRILYKE